MTVQKGGEEEEAGSLHPHFLTPTKQHLYSKYSPSDAAAQQRVLKRSDFTHELIYIIQFIYEVTKSIAAIVQHFDTFVYRHKINTQAFNDM